VLASLVLVPNLVFGWRFNPAQKTPRPGHTAVERALQEGAPWRVARVLGREPLFLPPNLPQLSGVSDAQGAGAAGLAPFLQLVRAADPAALVSDKYFLAFRDPAVLQTPLLRLLSVGWLLSDSGPDDPAARHGEVGLYRLAGALPRFRAVARVEPYDDADAARRRLLSPTFDPRTTVLVPAEQARRLPPLAEGAGAAVTVRHEAPSEVVLEVEAAGAVVLVSSEAAWPEWRTDVDGAAAETLLVNTAFRGVAVPAGRHRVTMRYVPRALMVGLALTACALVTLVALARRW
jgi:hypothetical protein